MDYDSDFVDMSTKTSQGSIHCRHHKGAGPKIIFLHGLAATTRSYKKLVEILPDGLDIYLVDLLGHGQSDAPQISYNIDVQVDVIREFVQINMLKDFYLFGHSYGGWVTALYASRDYPCKGIILEDSAGLETYFSELIKRKGTDGYKSDMLRQAMSFSANEDVIRSILDSNATSEKLDRQNLADIKKPTLIIWGGMDASVNVKYAGEFSDQIKKSLIEIIEDAGHTPHFSHPKEVSEMLLDFIGYES